MMIKGCAKVGKHRTSHNHVDHVVAKTHFFFCFLFFLLLRFVDPRERELRVDTDKMTLYLHPSNMVLLREKKPLVQLIW